MFHIRINGCRVSFVQSTQTNAIHNGLKYFFKSNFYFFSLVYNISSIFLNISWMKTQVGESNSKIMPFYKGFKSTETCYSSGEMWLLQAICCPLKSQQLQLDLKMVSWAHYELIVKGEESCYCALASHFITHCSFWREFHSKKTGTFINKIDWCKAFP